MSRPPVTPLPDARTWTCRTGLARKRAGRRSCSSFTSSSAGWRGSARPPMRETILAERIITAIALGPVNTRVRAYADSFRALSC
jgi:hypothetical protein